MIILKIDGCNHPLSPSQTLSLESRALSLESLSLNLALVPTVAPLPINPAQMRLSYLKDMESSRTSNGLIEGMSDARVGR